MPRGLTVANLIDRAASRYGDRQFAIRDTPVAYRNLGYGHSGETMTFTEALKVANGVAAALRDRLGVRAGDRIATVLTNVPEQGLFFIAAARLGAMLTSRNLLSTVTLSSRMLRLGRKDFGVMALPLAHIFGFTTGIVGGLYSGASGYLMRFFEPEKVLAAIEKYHATLFMGVPAMYNLMLESHPEKYDLSSMRYWISGADAMPVDQIKRFEKLGGRFIEGYGLVETSPIISVNPYFARRHGSVGLPVPGVKVRVMDENGRMLKRGEVGEFVVRGPNVMKGYWGDGERNAEAFEYGWFHTGDMGYRDRIGYLYFVDREKDVVKSGGYSVFSREVEEEILRNEKVHEVAIVGAPHPTKGEVPVAFVQLKAGETATEDELLAWSREHIAGYKAPRQVRIIDEMPLTMTLKVMKRELRRRLEEEAASGGGGVPPA